MSIINSSEKYDTKMTTYIFKIFQTETFAAFKFF